MQSAYKNWELSKLEELLTKVFIINSFFLSLIFIIIYYFVIICLFDFLLIFYCFYEIYGREYLLKLNSIILFICF